VPAFHVYDKEEETESGGPLADASDTLSKSLTEGALDLRVK
jgi:hypothetical protein